MGLSREEAKALLIDSAIPWNDKKTFADISLLGYGVVPIKIEDILSTPDDEIKFIVSDVLEHMKLIIMISQFQFLKNTIHM